MVFRRFPGGYELINNLNLLILEWRFGNGPRKKLISYNSRIKYDMEIKFQLLISLTGTSYSIL